MAHPSWPGLIPSPDLADVSAAATFATGSRYATIIETRFRDELEAFKGTRGKSEIYASLRAVTEYTANEYGNRFLVELIQNGHDAHAKGGVPGEIWCFLAAGEGEHGTLYVANQGQPFGDREFAAICQFARSSKRPGESIGNKGIGFRSVLQVSEYPEVYSAHPSALGAAEAERFEGFCFSFARPHDLIRLVPDPELRKAVERDVPPHVLPVALTEQSSRVHTFARAGFSTVVRLPIKSADARSEVMAALEALVGGPAPILLFLERISRIRVETEELSEGDWYLDVSRQRKSAALDPPHDVRLDVVELRIHEDGAPDEVDRYLLTTFEVDEAKMRDVIEVSIRADKLPSAWRGWKGVGRVGLATPLTGEARAGILYNYLPMGPDSAAPFLGHLDAPFYAKIDRTSLHPSVPLNDFLFDEAARLAGRAALYLAAASGEEFRDAAIDLIAWDKPVHERLANAFRGLGTKLEEALVLPVLGVDANDGRAPLKTTFRWHRDDLTILSSQGLVAHTSAQILPMRVKGMRLHRLEQLKLVLTAQALTPSNAQLAIWAPTVAKHLHASGAAASEWDGFYSDLAQLFRHEPRLLERRAIILDAQNRLLPAGATQTMPASQPPKDSTGPTVFFSPRRERTYNEEEVDARVDLTIPSALSPFITYTHPGLTWAPTAGGAEARELFARHKLVRKFERRELREYLRDLLSDERSDEVRGAALDLAYRLSSSGADALEPRLDRMNLYVPTVAGTWIPATHACFSPEWETPAAAALATYIEYASDVSPLVSALRERCIAAPSSWSSAIDDVVSWTAFLLRAGVSDGLPPEQRGDLNARFKPIDLAWRPHSIGSTLSGNGAAEWLAAVKGARAAYPKHEYQLTRPIPFLPGQELYEQLSDIVRAALAELIARGLLSWPDSVFSVEIKKAQGNPDTFMVPSPLSYFLQTASWVRTTATEGDERYLRASEVWLAAENADRPPSFVPQPARHLRTILSDSPASARMNQRLGAGMWADPDCSGREVRALALWLTTRSLTTEQLHSLEDNYRRAWRSVLGQEGQGSLENGPKPWPLIVRRAGQLVSVGGEASTDAGVSETVYITDERWGLRTHLLESLGRPIFDPGVSLAHVPVAVAAACQLAGIAIEPVSSLQPVILVGGIAFTPDPSLPHLVAGRLAWLGELIALLLELEGSGNSRSRVQRERAVERLLRIRIQVAADVSVHIETDTIPLPDTAGGILAVDHPRAPTILIPPRMGALDRSTLPSLARPIAELLEFQSVASPLELALARLVRSSDSADFDEPPSLEEISRSVGVAPSRLEEIRASLRTSISALLTKIRPVICYVAGRDAALAFGSGEENFQTSADVARVLEEHVQALPCSPTDVVAVCSASLDLEEVRDGLRLDYAPFNAALRALAPSYAPIHHRQEQNEAFLRYKERNEAAIVGALRQGYLATFQSGQSLDAYVEARDLNSLTPDAGWLDLCRLPSEALMRRRVTEWLDANGADSSGDVALAPVEDIRTQLRDLLRRLGDDFGELLPAWCHARGQSVPPPWMGEDVGNALATLAYEQGWADFQPLTVPDAIERLRRAGVWPQDMPTNADAATLGLSDAHLRWRQDAAAREREQREEARFTVTLNGEAISSAPHRQRDFENSVLASITAADLAFRPELATLEAIDAVGSDRSGGSSGQRRSGQRRPSEAQLEAIGYAGELIAMRWLEQHFGVDAALCWKSMYSERYLGRSGGSDSLGYDFAIQLDRLTLIEVKASVSNDMEIALGETEVRTAYDFRSERKAQYRILYISHVLDSAHRKIALLPNPFSRRGHDHFRVLGQGMRLAFAVRP